ARRGLRPVDPTFPTRRSSDLEPADHPVEQVRRTALEHALAGARGTRPVDVVITFAPALDEARNQLGRILAVRVEDQRRAFGDLVDRKSTRLNSSHVKNSYAVF